MAALLLVGLLALPQMGGARAETPSATLLQRVGERDAAHGWTSLASGAWQSPAFVDGARRVVLDTRSNSLSFSSFLDVLDANGATLLHVDYLLSRWQMGAARSAEQGTSWHKLTVDAAAPGWRVLVDDALLVAGSDDLGDMRAVRTGIIVRQIRVFDAGAVIDTSFGADFGGFTAVVDGLQPVLAWGGALDRSGANLVHIRSTTLHPRVLLVAPAPGPRWLLQEDVVFDCCVGQHGFAIVAGLDAQGQTLWSLGVESGALSEIVPTPDSWSLFLRTGDGLRSVGAVPLHGFTSWWVGRVDVLAAGGRLTVRFERAPGIVDTLVAEGVPMAGTEFLAFGDADRWPALDGDELGADGAGAASYSGAMLAAAAPGVGVSP